MPPRFVGTVYGITAFGGGLGAILFMWATGALVDAYGSFTIPFVLAGVMPLLGYGLFVLLAGVARMRLVPFALSIAVGRGVRYFGEGWLAVLYGEHAIDYIHENGSTVSLILAGIVVAGAAVLLIVRSMRRSKARSASGSATIE